MDRTSSNNTKKYLNKALLIYKTYFLGKCTIFTTSYYVLICKLFNVHFLVGLKHNARESSRFMCVCVCSTKTCKILNTQ